MIVIVHENDLVTSLESQLIFQENFIGKNVAEIIIELAKLFPQELLVWIHKGYRSFLKDEIPSFFLHKKMMHSYNPEGNFLIEAIGYVEETPFIKVNKSVVYPTWQMSGIVGGIFATTLSHLNPKIIKSESFDYFLNSVAKRAIQSGLQCYSNPNLLKGKNIISAKKMPDSQSQLFRFVKQHYRFRWVFLLLLNFMVYEKKFPFLAFFKSIFYKNKEKLQLSGLELPTENIQADIDVLIPTIGRKKYLHDFLKDLVAQTQLPKRVIIVEQNPLKESVSDLDYLTLETWPFEILHVFTHKSGACNARNIALSKASCDWVFLADDDIRIENNFIEKAFLEITKNKTKAGTFNCLKMNEKKVYTNVHQWNVFGSGCSIIKKEEAKNIFFDEAFEFGYGEDMDFGMQLRNHGIDVLFFPEPSILHLNAPFGGFRTKFIQQWQNDAIQPKPSPTVMLYKLKSLSSKQLLGYKTVLFFKFYKVQNIKNPIRYYQNFQKQWERSQYWANELKNDK